MRSIGIDLEPWVGKGLLQFRAARPTYGGIEEVLLVTHKHISSFQPSIVVVDPITNLLMVSTLRQGAVHAHAAGRFSEDQGDHRDFHRKFPTAAGGSLEASEESVSSLMDAWLLLKAS